MIPQLYTHFAYCCSLVDLIVEDHQCQFHLGSWNIFINNDISLQSRKMIDDWLVFDIGWTVLAIMVKRWAKGWALGGHFNWCRIKMIYYLGSDGQRQSIMNNWWIWPYLLNHTRPIYELSLDCSPTTIERPVGEKGDDNKGFTQISLFRWISSESIFHLYQWTTLQRANNFFLHWDRPTAGNLYCNRISRNYWIGSNRIIKKEK